MGLWFYAVKQNSLQLDNFCTLIKSFTQRPFFLVAPAVEITMWSSRNASAVGEWLMRDCSEQQCSALMPIDKDTGLSSTHLCWEPCGHSWFFTVKTVLTNLSLFSFPLQDQYFSCINPLLYYKGVLLELSSVLCTSKDQFKCYYDKLLANSCVSEVTDILLLLSIHMSICGLCLVSQNPTSYVALNSQVWAVCATEAAKYSSPILWLASSFS